MSPAGVVFIEPGQSLGANWIRPDGWSVRHRAVVGRLATLKADRKVTCRATARASCLMKSSPVEGLAGGPENRPVIPARLGSVPAWPETKLKVG